MVAGDSGGSSAHIVHSHNNRSNTVAWSGLYLKTPLHCIYYGVQQMINKFMKKVKRVNRKISDMIKCHDHPMRFLVNSNDAVIYRSFVHKTYGTAKFNFAPPIRKPFSLSSITLSP